jgi:hypothetical protein
MFKWIALLLAVGAGAAWLTKPGESAFDDMLRARLEQQVASADIGTQDDPIAAIALVACKLRPSVEDRVLFTRIRAEGFGKRTLCTGAFTNLWCHETAVER